MERNYSPIDRFIAALDEGLRVSTGEAPEPFRNNPAGELPAPELEEADRAHVAGLMRINHTGEVCAQALYQGQAVTAGLERVRRDMERAAGLLHKGMINNPDDYLLPLDAGYYFRDTFKDPRKAAYYFNIAAGRPFRLRQADPTRRNLHLLDLRANGEHRFL